MMRSDKVQLLLKPVLQLLFVFTVLRKSGSVWNICFAFPRDRSKSNMEESYDP